MTNIGSVGVGPLIIIDARFAYEWEGGHINGSTNVRSITHLKVLFQEYRECNACVVFHCEFSHNRGPTMMHAFRDHDRMINLQCHPHLCYPSIFLLQGGYKQFYEDCPDLCTGGYVPMRDPHSVQSGALKQSHCDYLTDVVRVGRMARTGNQGSLKAVQNIAVLMF